MESWVVAFLGVIALSSLMQTGFLIGLALNGRRLARRLDEIQRRIDDEIRPGLRNLTRASESVVEISDIARDQARRLSAVVAGALDSLEETIHTAQALILRPLAPLADLAALIKGVRRGIEVYRRLGTVDHERKGDARRYVGDEHLFI
ncbi:MAG: hypothetical protein JXO72_06160 [Vicinamibacteria bacterium]|nr:hypothetical protein [Vicinamibacteria bacterium]